MPTTQVEIAKRLGLDVSSVNKILNRAKGPVFKKETVDKVFRTARELGYDFGRIKFRHRRRHDRREVKVSTEMAVYNRDGSLHDQGSATILDISAGGACLTDVALPMGTLPIEPFTVHLRPMKKSLKNLEVSGRVVRLVQNGGLTIGVSFENVDHETQKRLEKVAS